jgi:hypothetical protein
MEKVMAKNVSVRVDPGFDEGGYKLAVTRDWTEEEVAETVAFLKQECAEIWAALVQLELTTGDLNGSEANDHHFGALSNLHPECEPNEIADLSWKVRLVRRGELGLE